MQCSVYYVVLVMIIVVAKQLKLLQVPHTFTIEKQLLFTIFVVVLPFIVHTFPNTKRSNEEWNYIGTVEVVADSTRFVSPSGAA